MSRGDGAWKARERKPSQGAIALSKSEGTWPCSRLQRRLRDPHQLEDFNGASLRSNRARGLRPLNFPVDDAKRDRSSRQLDRQR